MVNEENLDPVDWDDLRTLGHKMIDDMLDYLKNIRERPVWQNIPPKVQSTFKTPIPRNGIDRERIYNEFKQNILPYPTGNIHPRFWGWFLGTGTPFAILAEMLAAAMNSCPGGLEHTANYVEKQVINWTKEILDYNPDASGLLVSGCSMANFIGLTIARNIKAEYNIIEKGVRASDKDLLFYGSTEVHSSIDKAMQLLGLGINSLRKIPVKKDFTINISSLKKTIEDDIKNGLKPICIIGNAGTVNTGAIDDLHNLADLAEEFNMWFHVDGAFGVWCKLSHSCNHLVEGIKRADSVAFDFHKWMYVQYEAGCILVKNRKNHYRSFNLTPDYLSHQTRGIASGDIWYSDYGPQLSRGDRALKIWMSIKEHGIDKYRRLIEQNIQQAQYLTSLIRKTKELELLAPTITNVVNFRYNDGHKTDEELKKLNEEIVLQLQEKGIAIPSSTMINGHYSIRLGITNHRSIKSDFDIFIEELLNLGKNLTKRIPRSQSNIA